MTKRSFHYVSLAMVLAVSFLGSAEAQARREPAAGPKAGNITALLPKAKITRGAGRTRAVVEARKGDEVVYNDLIQTEKGGRARITLNDQSILSLGSQAELRIVRHDARTQQTALQLGYGKMRAEVASITRDGGRFELRTPTAVAGVIGTDFGTDSSIPGVTTFLCISGIVEVRGAGDRTPGAPLVKCPAGNTVKVESGLPPTQPTPLTKQQIQQLVQDTEPAVISALSPSSIMAGTDGIISVAGSKLTGINAIEVAAPVSGSPTGAAGAGRGAGPVVNGVKAALSGELTDTKAEFSVSVAKDATPGIRTVTFKKPNGQDAMAIFTVLAMPGSEGKAFDPAAVRKAYFDIMEEERQAAISGVNALGLAVQQAAADAEQIVSDENDKLSPKADTSRMARELQADVSPLLEAMTKAGGDINLATGRNAQRFMEDSDILVAGFPGRGLSDEQKFAAVQGLFDKINPSLLESYADIQKGLTQPSITASERVVATMNRWLEQLRALAGKQSPGPLPRINADDRSVDLGAPTLLDGGRSAAAPGASIVSYKWVLCDPGYKPQQVGVRIPAADTQCRPLGNFAASSSEFKVETCQLKPEVYVARLIVTDSNNQSSAMDARVRVIPPQYDPPGLRLRSLADAYQQLQPNVFSGFFHESFSGLTELQESIRRTFAVLASMNINLRLSQAAIDCNEATVRADWEQNYTFKDDQTCANAPAGTLCQRVVFKQQEQLTVRMKRVPGRNWYITEFQGDNGTVQGTPPGPIQRDLSLPDLRIASLTPAALPAAGRENSVIGIAPGLNGFAAEVRNIGQAALQGSVKVRFVARDGNGNHIATDIRDLAGPVAVGESATVVGQLNVPDLGPGVNARIFAGVNPGCVVPEQNCDASNITLLEIVIGTVDLQVTGFTPVGAIIGTQPGQIDVQITNSGSRTSLATSGNLRLLFGTTLVGSGNIPPVAPGAGVTVPLTFTAPNLSGAQNATIAIAPATTGEINPANDNFTGTLNVTAASVDLKASGLAITTAGPFLSGQTVNVSLNVQNNGNRPSAITDALACRLTGTPGTQNFAPVALAPIAAGATATGLTYSFVLPANFAGGNTLTCGVSQDPFEAAGAIADNQASVPITLGLNVDLQIVNVPPVTGADQMGSSASVTFGVKNFGPDAAPSGWDVVLKINNSQVGNFVSSIALPGGATQPVTISYTTPQIAPAPADIANVPATLQVNANLAIAETDPNNNIFTAALRLVDFTLTTLPTSVKAVNGRNFFVAAVQVLPAGYPLPLNISYTGLPNGLTAGAALGQNVVGTPSGTVGSFSVTGQGTADGVTHNASAPFVIDVFNEITFLAGAPPVLTAALGGGPTQNVSIAVAGGIYPLTLAVQSPLGVIITGPTTLAAPGNVTYSLSADLTAATGPQVFNFKAQDAGSPPNTAGNFVQGPVSYVVNSFVDLQAQSLSVITAPPFLSGQTAGAQLNVRNVGNGPSNAADTYACSVSGPGGTVSVASGLVPSIAGQGGTTSISFAFTMPVNMAPSATLTCVLSQDPGEPAPNLTDNTNNAALTVSPNVDLQIVNVAAVPAAIQMGSAGSTSFDVKNFGLDTAPSGWNVVLRVSGSPVGTPFVAASPLGGGASVPVTINFTVPQVAPAPADVSGITADLTANANSAIVETNTANNIFATTLRLVDFAVQRNFATATGVVGRAFALSGATTILPNTYPLPITVDYTGLPAGLLGSGTGNLNITGALTAPGTSTVNASATVDGVTHSMASAMSIDSLDEITMSLGTAFSLSGGGSAQPFQVNVTGGIYPVTLNLTLPSGVTIAGGATNPAVLNSPGAVTWQLIADVSVTSGTSLTDIVVHATDGGSESVGPGSVNFAPPYDRMQAAYDLEVTNAVGSSANFSGRDFSAFPLLSGEGGDFTVTVVNHGPGPSPAGIELKALLFSEVTVSTAPAILPAIPSSGSVNVNVHVRMEEPLFNGSTSLDFFADADVVDSNSGNNSFGLGVALSDWQLSVAGLGVQGDELSIVIPGPGTANTNLQLSLDQGAEFTPIEIMQGTVSSFMTAVLPSSITSATNPVATISASTSPVTPDGFYAVQVIARMKDGATVTAQRSAIIHIIVNGGVPVDTVSLAASPNNESDGLYTGCTNPCAPVQIDGLLVETVQLTATRSGGSSGSTDLVFTDQGSNVVSNVTAAGSPLTQQLTAVPYGTPMNVNFGAEEFSGGVINPGLTDVLVSATAVSTAARGAPPLDPVGNQQYTLHFNVGDIDVNTGCIAIGPGQQGTFNLSWVPNNGFNKTLSLQWVSTAGANVTVPGITAVPPPYSTTSVTFTNNETAEGSFVQFVLAATISNGNGSATKFFNIGLSLNTSGCASAGGSATARDPDFSTLKSYWKRGATTMVAGSTRPVEKVAPVTMGLPDLQIKPVDVSVSPSIPRAGDTLDVRFKVTNAGDGASTDLPISLVVNGQIAATETYSLKPGASTLGAFQYQLPAVDDAARDRSARKRAVRYSKLDGPAELDGPPAPAGRFAAQLVVDPRATVKQRSTANKSVALTKSGLGTPLDVMPASPTERVYLEMNTVCSGFRVTSGAVVNCGGGADLDIAIEDFKSSRFSLNASLGIVDLGIVEPQAASADGAQFNPNASLVLGHTYAVQLTGGRVGYVKFSASLTPRQLEAEAKRRFGLNGVRILRKLGGDTSGTGIGDVSGRISADALMYFDMSFRP